MTVSVRKLRQDFTAAVGLSPKVYGRVHRLQRLARAIATTDAEPDWAAVAVDHGYYDQAHMIHDFRALAGVTPMKYAPRSASDWNHTVVTDARADSYNTGVQARARPG